MVVLTWYSVHTSNTFGKSCLRRRPAVFLLVFALLDVTRYRHTIRKQLWHFMLRAMAGIKGNPWSCTLELKLESHQLVWEAAWFSINPVECVCEGAKRGLTTGFWSVEHFLMILYEVWKHSSKTEMRINLVLMYNSEPVAFVGKEQKSLSFEEQCWSVCSQEVSQFWTAVTDSLWVYQPRWRDRGPQTQTPSEETLCSKASKTSVSGRCLGVGGSSGWTLRFDSSSLLLSVLVYAPSSAFQEK